MGEAELRAIELDIAILDLRKNIDIQAGFMEEWREFLKSSGRDSVLPHEWTEEDRREEKEFKAKLKEAELNMEGLRKRLSDLESQRPPRNETDAQIVQQSS